MREPTPEHPVFGLMAEFDQPERLLESVRRTRDAGFRQIDASSPFPIEGLAEELGFSDRRIPLLTLAGGVFGAALGYSMQVYTNLDYPIAIGGRPLVAIPAFMLITFELLVLFAVLFSIGGMLVLNRLPRLNHPIFEAPEFHLASSNKFFLIIFGNDARFAEQTTRHFLEDLDPVGVYLLGHTEEPE